MTRLLDGVRIGERLGRQARQDDTAAFAFGSGEVPTQPVCETSTITPSGPVYLTSTLLARGACPWPTPSALFTSCIGSEPTADSFAVASSMSSTWKPMWWMPLYS